MTRSVIVLCLVLLWSGQCGAEALREMLTISDDDLNVKLRIDNDPPWRYAATVMGQAAVLEIESPAKVVPPVSMHIARSQQAPVKNDTLLRDGAMLTLPTLLRRFNSPNAAPPPLEPMQYGDLNGYQAMFSGIDGSTPVDVLVFFSVDKLGKAYVLQAATLAGKRNHLLKVVRRTWGSLRWLDAPTAHP